MTKLGQYRCSRSIFGAFHLREENFKRFVKLVREFTETRVSVKFELTGNDFIDIPEFDGTLDYDELNYYRINAVIISSYSRFDDKTRSAVVSFSDSKNSGGICSVVASGDHDLVDHLVRKIKREVVQTTYWYSRLYNPISAGIACGVSGMIYANVVSNNASINKYIENGYLRILLYFVGLIIVAHLTMTVMAAARRWLFPAMIIDVGMGVKVDRSRAALRNIIFIAVGLAVVVNVVSSYIPSFLSLPPVTQ